MQLRKCLGGSLLAATALAQSSVTSADQPVISVFMIGGMGEASGEITTNLYASIVDNDATATTMEIGCDDTGLTDGELCNLFSGFTIINGPSTFEGGYSYSGAYGGNAMTMGCEITASTTAVCSQTVVADQGFGDFESDAQSNTAPGPETTSLTTDIPSSDITYYPITITAGALKTGGESGESGGAVSSTTGASASQTSSSSDNSSDGNRAVMAMSGGLTALIAAVMVAL
ncbi:uncharacterized protein HMPREF1541_01862 [Cyphellophora europaea CBS 101466]|uniref:GPI anchored cell wall protein n=1 Tax=Cyphellophora europaea (strain CBS 101466) TaxID=1220924 RepID=W2S413_CYPE1|nr:uncharacterized protein HMPREF1541_01862 [Cyphellophora europaea CBS 101466]ETN42704.1 hypothetical protein HMPREF1541_01862 [Cyphellophora europaea CBS 101466]